MAETHREVFVPAKSSFSRPPRTISLTPKVVVIYNQFFAGQDPVAARVAAAERAEGWSASEGGDKKVSSAATTIIDRFWEELFLLDVRPHHLVHTLRSRPLSQLRVIRGTLNTIFERCCRAIGHVVQGLAAEPSVVGEMDLVRARNAAKTLTVLLRGIFRGPGRSSHPHDLLILTTSHERADIWGDVLDSVAALLQTTQQHSEDSWTSLQRAISGLLVAIVTVSDNIDANGVMEYAMQRERKLMEAMQSVVVSKSQCIGDVVIAWAVMCQYGKAERGNPLLQQMALLSSDTALRGIAGMVGAVCKQAAARLMVQKHLLERDALTTGIWGWIKSWWMAIVPTEKEPIVMEDRVPEEWMESSGALYVAGKVVHGGASEALSVFVMLYEFVHTHPHFPVLLFPQKKEKKLGDPIEPSPMADLVAFCKVLFHDARQVLRVRLARICFLIMRCVAEHPSSGNMLHDVQRGLVQGRPLAADIIDLCTAYMKNNMQRHLAVGTFVACLNVIHVIMIRSKRLQRRLDGCQWTELWSVLGFLLRCISKKDDAGIREGALRPTPALPADMKQVAQGAVRVLNFATTFGDALLPDSKSYDALFYEILRNREVFAALEQRWTSDAERLSSVDTRYDIITHPPPPELANIRAIQDQVGPLIEREGCVTGQVLSPDDVLKIIHSSFSVLSLRYMENLENLPKYAEHAEEVSFLGGLVAALASSRAGTEE